MDFLSILLEELALGWEDYGKNLRKETEVRSARDFLPTLEYFPIPFTPWTIRALLAVLSLPDYITAALGASIARLVLPSLGRDKKLHQKVIPLDRVAETLGPGFVRDFLRFDRTEPLPRELKGPFANLRKIIAGKFDLDRFVRMKILRLAVNGIVKAVNVVMMIGACVASAAICRELLIRAEQLERGALGQGAPRKRVRIVGGGSILRRLPGGSPP